MASKTTAAVTVANIHIGMSSGSSRNSRKNRTSVTLTWSPQTRETSSRKCDVSSDGALRENEVTVQMDLVFSS